MHRLFLALIAIGLLATTGCASSGTTPIIPTETPQQVGNLIVSNAWSAYGSAYSMVTALNNLGCINASTAAHLTTDFQASYDSITALQSIISTLATTQPSLGTVLSAGATIGLAAVEVYADIKGLPTVIVGNPPQILNIPPPPATPAELRARLRR